MGVTAKAESGGKRALPKFALFQGLMPFAPNQIPSEAIAGLTLAALAIPEVMGYTSIAGMPVITGLYTILLPVLAFAVFGSSRHLVVGADSATAAVMAASLAGLAVSGSTQYVALAGLLALMAGGLLFLSRLAGLGFIADFLSRTVLIGFLTGVGIQVAAGQVGGIFGVESGSGGTIRKLLGTLANLGDTSLATLAVSVVVIAIIVGTKRFTPKVPGALIAVVGSIAASWGFDLASHGVATLGKLPSGLPNIGIPDVAWSDIPPLFATSVSILVLILAQSAATSRAYASKYNEPFSENVDLIGLGTASLAAGLSGAFPVNGSPTKTQMIDGAGGKSQMAQVTTAIIVGIVLLFLTAPIQYMPKAVLASVVFLIGIELVDIGGLRTVLRLRPDEFVVAVATAATVVLIGVEQGIVLAIFLSIVDHLRRSYHPNNIVLRPADGLVVDRFAASLYYANANRFLEDVNGLVSEGDEHPVEWLCIDASAMADIDYTGAKTIEQAHGELVERGIRLVFVDVMEAVRVELDRYGLTELLGADAFYASVADVVDAFGRRSTPSS